MSFLIVLAALAFLMFVAYRGYSVILFAPIAALGAVLFTDPSLVPPMFSGVFMEKMVGFVKNYFPVFMLGAVFGKVIELSGFSKSIVSAVIGILGKGRAVLSIVVVCAILTYGGVSLFVVVFAVYPFAAEMFRQGDIPKRLIPCTIALGAFSFTMDALPGTPQIQNIIPTTFFNTTTWAAPILGLVGSIFVFAVGLFYIENRRHAAHKNGEGYGTNLVNEPEPFEEKELPNPWIAILPLFVVGIANFVLTTAIPRAYGAKHEMILGDHPIVTQIGPVAAIWAVEGALILGILTVFAVCVATGAWQVRGWQQGGRRRCAAGFAQHGIRIRLRRRDRAVARLQGGVGRAELDSKSAGQRGRHRNRARRHYRFGLRRHEHRAGCNVRNLHCDSQGRPHSARSAASNCGDGQRRHGYLAAQWRRHHPACGDGPDAQASLQGRLRDHADEDGRGVRRNRGVLSHGSLLRLSIFALWPTRQAWRAATEFANLMHIARCEQRRVRKWDTRVCS